MSYLPLTRVFAEADILSLHCPLLFATHHIVDAEAIASTKDGVMLVNTSRGALVDTRAAIDGLKRRKIGFLALDVYEEEEGVVFEDLSGQIVDDDLLMRLVTFPNVLVTSHQAFLTREALANIAEATFDNLDRFADRGVARHPVP